MPRQYPQSLKDRAVRTVLDRLERDDAPSRYSVIREAAPTFDISVETLRRWVKQSKTGEEKKCPKAENAQAEIRKLKRENAELRRVNGILMTASAFFAAELDPPIMK